MFKCKSIMFIVILPSSNKNAHLFVLYPVLNKNNQLKTYIY